MAVKLAKLLLRIPIVKVVRLVRSGFKGAMLDALHELADSMEARSDGGFFVTQDEWEQVAEAAFLALVQGVAQELALANPDGIVGREHKAQRLVLEARDSMDPDGE